MSFIDLIFRILNIYINMNTSLLCSFCLGGFVLGVFPKDDEILHDGRL